MSCNSSNAAAFPPKVAVLWRGDARERREARLVDGRFAPLAHALAAAGLSPEPCVYDEAANQAVEGQLAGCAAALVFVNPLQGGLRRGDLDAILRRAAAGGVVISAHPDVIDRMGVKAVLWRTRALGWGSDVAFYGDAEEFARTFPMRLAAGPRVLKPNRGNGGQGVWKVAAAGVGQVTVQAADGDPSPRTMPISALMTARMSDFTDAGGLVDQAWLPRIAEGMARCYMSGDRVAGFGFQKVRALAAPDAGPGGPRSYSGPADPRFQRLKALMEQDWTPGLCRTLGIDPQELPAIWDADFLLGDKDEDGADRYVLCEINASSVYPMPDEAPAAIADTICARLRVARSISARAD
jgi:hypothetical protein